MKRTRRPAIAAAAVLALACCAWLSAAYFEHRFLTTGPNGANTPATYGAPFERVAIASGDRHLSAYLVAAPSSCSPRVALLIFHGVGETISYWAKAQKYLYRNCVNSLVFDYSGHGDSSRPGTIGNLDADAIAAYAYFSTRFAGATRRCVLGHSMGNGPMLAAIGTFQPQPACVVVANAFSSLRDLAAHAGTPFFLSRLLPDDWNNVANVASNHASLLIVNSDADSVNPVQMGRRIFAAASEPKRMLVVHGFRHNALYRRPQADWWSPVLLFIEGKPS